MDSNATLNTAQKKATADHSTKQLLTFWLNRDTFAIDILNIKEIIGYESVTHVPLMSEAVAGVINLRGNVVPVVKLSSRFGFADSPKTKRTSIVIVALLHQGTSVEMGIIVDEVSEVIELSTDNIEPTPSFGTKIRTDFIGGMGKTGKKLLTILDIENVLSIEELSIPKSPAVR